MHTNQVTPAWFPWYLQLALACLLAIGICFLPVLCAGRRQVEPHAADAGFDNKGGVAKSRSAGPRDGAARQRK